ncbi:hypothetical protein HRbin29_00001 [bacterium HR29]|nr:hypothetical protein HRbin29_00001 [bacterium HR29]
MAEGASLAASLRDSRSNPHVNSSRRRAASPSAAPAAAGPGAPNLATALPSRLRLRDAASGASVRTTSNLSLAIREKFGAGSIAPGPDAR